jgi:hypothetical protein
MTRPLHDQTFPKAFRDDLVALMQRHRETVPAVELLASLAHVTGRVYALVPTIYSGEELMTLVWENLGEGNRAATNEIIAAQGGRH